MDRVILTFFLEHTSREVDLDLPTNVPFTHMMQAIAAALDLQEETETRAYQPMHESIWLSFQSTFPKKVDIHPAQTIADVCLLDGSIIRVQKSAPPLAELITLDGQHIFYVYEPRALLGRPPRDPSLHRPGWQFIDLTLVDPERTTSRPHARLEWIEGRWYLEPFPQTMNPTRYEGHILHERTVIEHGRVLQLGNVQLQFKIFGQP